MQAIYNHFQLALALHDYVLLILILCTALNSLKPLNLLAWSPATF